MIHLNSLQTALFSVLLLLRHHAAANNADLPHKFADAPIGSLNDGENVVVLDSVHEIVMTYPDPDYPGQWKAEPSYPFAQQNAYFVAASYAVMNVNNKSALVVLGGGRFSNKNPDQNNAGRNFFSYTIQDGLERRSPSLKYPNAFGAAVVDSDNNHLYLIGGTDGDVFERSHFMRLKDVSSGTGVWEDLAHPGFTQRQALAAAYSAGKIFTAGGVARHVTGYMSNVEFYDIHACERYGDCEFKRLPDLVHPRAYASMLPLDCRILVVGGLNHDEDPVNHGVIEMIQPAADGSVNGKIVALSFAPYVLNIEVGHTAAIFGSTRDPNSLFGKDSTPQVHVLGGTNFNTEQAVDQTIPIPNKAVDAKCLDESCTDCAPGYSGNQCDTACPGADTCYGGCGPTGECVSGSTCVCNLSPRYPNTHASGNTCDACDAHWTGGPFCDVCESGFYGSTCAQCSCDRGTCIDGFYGNGTCICDMGYAGARCSDCADGYFRTDAESECVQCMCNVSYGVKACDGFLCSMNGNCTAGANSSVPSFCSCNPGFEGRDCASRVSVDSSGGSAMPTYAWVLVAVGCVGVVLVSVVWILRRGRREPQMLTSETLRRLQRDLNAAVKAEDFLKAADLKQQIEREKISLSEDSDIESKLLQHEEEDDDDDEDADITDVVEAVVIEEEEEGK